MTNSISACKKIMPHVLNKYSLDKGLTANIKNPELKKAYAQFTKNMFRAGEQAAANTKKTGKVDNVKLDADHKKINDAFFLLQSNELDIV